MPGRRSGRRIRSNAWITPRRCSAVAFCQLWNISIDFSVWMHRSLYWLGVFNCWQKLSNAVSLLAAPIKQSPQNTAKRTSLDVSSLNSCSKELAVGEFISVLNSGKSFSRAWLCSSIRKKVRGDFSPRARSSSCQILSLVRCSSSSVAEISWISCSVYAARVKPRWA